MKISAAVLGAELLQLRFKFLRQAAAKFHRLAGAGVEKPQTHRVEALPLQTGHCPFVAVHCVAQNRMTGVGHVNADLVGAACFQTAFHIGEALIPLQHLPVGHGTAAVGDHGHFLAVDRMAADGGIHGAAVLTQVSGDDAAVDPAEGVILQLIRETLMGKVVFRGDDEAAGVPVDAVDDAGEWQVRVLHQRK